MSRSTGLSLRYPGSDLKIVWLPLMTTLALPYSRHATLLESHSEHMEVFDALASDRSTDAALLIRRHIQ